MTSLPRIRVIGELMNNAYGRARHAWLARDVAGYQQLARLQAGGGAEILNVNLDGTQRVSVRPAEMLDFLPVLIPALQAVSDIPLSFDNPDLGYHRAALRCFDRAKCRGKPVLNSLAASRPHLDGMIALVREHDLRCIVMASEKFLPRGGSSQSLHPRDSYATVRRFVDLLVDRAGRTLDDIIVDPGLAPVGADTYGLVNLGLDTMRLCTADPHLRGLHFSVGLSNFAWGTPKAAKPLLERAYLTLAGRVGLDMALANVEANSTPLPEDDPLVARLEAALENGRTVDGESVEEAGFRQAAQIMEICSAYTDA
ncbi:MAG: dihydropteroate synthase [Opitutae bacterium]|nr:dihydropteroate synthase [Opitutae bacterium]